MSSSPLCHPTRVGSMDLRNRVVFGAHTTNLAEDGRPGERMIAYYRERARGGVATIVVEPVPVGAETRHSQMNFRSPREDRAAWERLTSIVHEAGAKIVLQLIHLGAHVDATVSERAAIAPGAGPSWTASQGAAAAAPATLDAVIEAFVAEAEAARAVGFDGIELFANYQGLIEQCWTAALLGHPARPPLEEACRVSLAICEGIRRRCGSNFVIGLAVSVGEPQPGLLSIDDIAAIVALHDRMELVDYVSCGSGGYRDAPSIVPPALRATRPPGHALVERLRARAIGARIQLETGLHTVADAEAALAAGADLVALVRPLICEPNWVAHLERGRPERSRPCAACNQACIGRRARDLWVSCLSNPRAGREWALPLPRSEWRDGPPPRALVVGGGPAGLEAARVLALRGWTVRLVEASARLGGRLRAAARLPGLERHAKLFSWYEEELARAGVEIVLGRSLVGTAVAAEATAFAATVVVEATGARPARRPFQRAHGGTIPVEGRPGTLWAIEDLIETPPAPGTSVLLIDDVHDHRGLGAACLLAEGGARVTLATSAPVAGNGLAGAGLQSLLRRRFARAGGWTRGDVVLLGWFEGRGRLRDGLTGEEYDVSADLLAWACPGEAPPALGDREVSGCPRIRVGDVAGARNAEAAILEAHRVALALPA